MPEASLEASRKTVERLLQAVEYRDVECVSSLLETVGVAERDLLREWAVGEYGKKDPIVPRKDLYRVVLLLAPLLPSHAKLSIRQAANILLQALWRDTNVQAG